MASRSRLSETVERRNMKRLVFSVAGIITVLFVVIKFGIPTLINFSLFLSGGGSTVTANNQQSPSILYPPTINMPFTATNSASIIVSGTAQQKTSVLLYVNNTLTDTVDTQDNGTFFFHNVTINSGQNTLQAKTKNDKSVSDFSFPVTVSYLNKPPSLTIDSPHDGDTIAKDSSSVTVSGKTDSEAHVTVNGFWAVIDANGTYSYNLSLQGGNNDIKVVATDQAGNTTEKDIKVNHAQ
ncbi:MAG TPA: hypothetical protein VGT05_01340 [Patescibacteria group bacterium]|nr:hypothetical protein [Patescibacteria group bacterium]